MNAKIIDTEFFPVFVAKKNLDYSLCRFEVNVLFVINGQLIIVTDRFEKKDERDSFFDKTDKIIVLKHIEDWKKLNG